MSLNRIFFFLFLLSFFLRPVASFAEKNNRDFCNKKMCVATACCLSFLGLSAGGFAYSAPFLNEASHNAPNSCAINYKNNGQNLPVDNPICLNSSQLGPRFQGDVNDQYGQPVMYSYYNASFSPCMGAIPECCEKYDQTTMCKMDTLPDGSIKVRDPILVVKDTHTGGMMALAICSGIVAVSSCFVWVVAYCCCP